MNIADVAPVHSVWQNRTSGRLVRVVQIYDALEAAKVRWTAGVERTIAIDDFVSRYKPESEI